MIHDGVRNVSIIGSVYAHNRERNPRLKGGSTATVIDSVMYNWGSSCVGVGARGNEKVLKPAEATLIGNLAVAGPDTRTRVFVKGHDPGARVYLRDNIAVDATGGALPMAGERVIQLSAPPRSTTSLAPAAALRMAGSRPARRDPIDARIIQSIIAGDGRIIDSQEEVGGYPARAATKRALAVPDRDRQRWLDALSKELAVDPTLDLAPLLKRLGMRGPG